MFVYAGKSFIIRTYQNDSNVISLAFDFLAVMKTFNFPNRFFLDVLQRMFNNVNVNSKQIVQFIVYCSTFTFGLFNFLN